jgi:SOS-response transcriptional repressor LexA
MVRIIAVNAEDVSASPALARAWCGPSDAPDNQTEPRPLLHRIADDPKDVICVEVDGMSMAGAGIYSGNLVWVNVNAAKRPVRNGDIVLASPAPGEYIIKRYRHPFLYSQPIADSDGDLWADKLEFNDDVEIVGAVVGVFRQIG